MGAFGAFWREVVELLGTSSSRTTAAAEAI